MKEYATFAMGCFWGPQALFSALPGVLRTKVGYIGGTTKNPSYGEVCSGMTGYAEAVEIEYDHSRITYRQLLDLFWKHHDPTTKNKQGPDYGSQYRSALFYHSSEQKKLAEASKAAHEQKLGKKIVTEIVKAPEFYRAEAYHQNYLQKKGLASCHL